MWSSAPVIYKLIKYVYYEKVVSYLDVGHGKFQILIIMEFRLLSLNENEIVLLNMTLLMLSEIQVT